MSIDKLKPCPFCGGKPVVYGRSYDVRVRCSKCGAIGSPQHFDGDDDDAKRAEVYAIAAWNQRAAIKGES